MSDLKKKKTHTFKVVCSFVSRPEKRNRTGPVILSARPPLYTGPYVWRVRSTCPTQFSSWVLNLHRHELNSEFLLKINYWAWKSYLYTTEVFHLVIFWLCNTVLTSLLSRREAQNNFSYRWPSRYEKVYRPEKLTTGNTFQLVLNYCQTDLDIFTQSVYIHKSAYIFKKTDVFSLSYEGYTECFEVFFKFRKFLCIYCTVFRWTPNDVLWNPVWETLV